MRLVFACELIDDVAQLSCCCDDPAEMNCDKTADCDQHSPAMAKDCCEISYQAVDRSIIGKTNGIQNADPRVLLLDAPQPPPGVLPPDSLKVKIAYSTSIKPTHSHILSATSGKTTYLRTLRLRI